MPSHSKSVPVVTIAGQEQALEHTDIVGNTYYYKIEKVEESLEIQVTGLRLNTYTVIFKNGDEILDTQTIAHGSSVKAPDVPKLPGYKFQYWDKDFNVVTEEMTIKAVFSKDLVDAKTILMISGGVLAFFGVGLLGFGVWMARKGGFN